MTSPVPGFEADRTLAQELRTWFEREAYAGPNGGSVEEVLDGRYQDEGFSSGLFRGLGEVSAKGLLHSDFDEVLGDSQRWFERIEAGPTRSRPLEDALADIFGDEGKTRALYLRLKARNQER